MLNQLNVRARFETRITLLQLSLLLLMLILLSRMVYLQWMQHDGLMLQAEQNRLNVVPILPTRGSIQDRFGEGLAVNHVSYQISMMPERVNDMKKTMAQLIGFMHWSPRQIRRIQKRIKKSRKDRPVLLADKLTWQQIAPLSARLHHLSGIDVKAGTHRYYPYKALTSHLIGYLSLARPEDVRRGFLRSEHVGRSGLERIFEQRLHGVLGNQQEEVDAFNRRVAVLNQSPPRMGENIHLSLNIRLQQAAAKAMKGRTGAVVVMDVHTGEILTLLSTPGIDTNHFTLGLEKEEWSSWLNNPQRPLLNRTVQAAYPPGSTWKMVTAFAGLRHHSQLARGHTRCPGYVQLADRKLRCWKRTGHGKVNIHDALQHSCDVYFYELADQLGMPALRQEALAWGFGKKTGVLLPRESRGHLASPLQQLSHGRKRTWVRGETMITGIGQGQTTVTPIQMARFAAAIANGGDILKPHLELGKAPEIIRHVKVNPDDLKRVREAMYAVANKPGGTAYYRLRHAAWKIAGKTGTAQVVAMSQDDAHKSKVPSEDAHKDHAWFMGYAPYDHPKIAFAIVIEHGGHGGSAAGPVALAMIQELKDEEDQRTQSHAY
ncbi:MAG: penicillin-binding protein 2 [Zetaproteobacteria bacterium]|nr:penicillin-binding protein 2 [Zetaproteobacteria bacterium]